MVVVCIAAMATAWAMAVAFERSLIPLGLTGRVEGGEWLDASGLQLRVVEVSGERLVVDTGALDGVTAGDHISKDPWERSLATPAGPVSLRPSGEFIRVTLVGFFTIVMVLCLVWRARRLGQVEP